MSAGPDNPEVPRELDQNKAPNPNPVHHAMQEHDDAIKVLQQSQRDHTKSMREYAHAATNHANEQREFFVARQSVLDHQAELDILRLASGDPPVSRTHRGVRAPTHAYPQRDRATKIAKQSAINLRIAQETRAIAERNYNEQDIQLDNKHEDTQEHARRVATHTDHVHDANRKLTRLRNNHITEGNNYFNYIMPQ